MINVLEEFSHTLVGKEGINLSAYCFYSSWFFGRNVIFECGNSLHRNTNNLKKFLIMTFFSIHQNYNIESPESLVFQLLSFFCFCALLAGLMRLLLLWSSINISNSTGADLSKDVYKKTLFQPYKCIFQK